MLGLASLFLLFFSVLSLWNKAHTLHNKKSVIISKDDNAENALIVVPPIFTACIVLFLCRRRERQRKRPSFCLVTGATGNAYRASSRVDFSFTCYCVAATRSSLELCKRYLSRSLLVYVFVVDTSIAVLWVFVNMRHDDRK